MDMNKFADNIMTPTRLPVLTHLGRVSGLDVYHYTARDGITHTLTMNEPKENLADALRMRIREIENVE